mmetsp:Transcript_4496/g.5973  ORF Transcript_4496/g.5973 Transcript_4496/m.5973 type:complete len:98 (+) Transcript_4496:624-917(+)
MKLLKEFLDPSRMSQRSSNIDDSNRTLSVLDELEAQEVLGFLTKESRVAGHVWGDIYRNKFLNSIRGAPEQLTPQDDGFDDAESEKGPVNMDKLEKS